MKQGFGINDAHVVVLQMISHDIVSGIVRMKPMVSEEIEWYAEQHERGEPFIDWYESHESRRSSPLRMRGQYLDLEWYHGQYNTVSRFLAFIMWMGKSTGILKDNNAKDN